MDGDFEIWKQLETRTASRECIAARLGLTPRDVSAARDRFAVALGTLTPLPGRVARVLLVELGITPQVLACPRALADHVQGIESLRGIGAAGMRSVADYVAGPTLARAA